MVDRAARKRILHFLSCATLLAAEGAQSREDPSNLCRKATSNAAASTGVPYDVLLAISQIESGRAGHPWPWTVNFGGDGKWYDTAQEAEAGATEAIGQGAKNIDLGCFQLNYRWHSDGFASIADMLEPDQNATYAARFLADYYAQTGDWALAAAAYHSATPEYAKAYQAKFEAAYSKLDAPVPLAAPETDAVIRRNGFPLLLAGETGHNGSLVPTTSGGHSLIGGP